MACEEEPTEPPQTPPPPPQQQPEPERLDPRRALLRKVAQLTKVVVHLNARNDEGEQRYERLRAGFEDEVRTISQDASLKVAAEVSKVKALLDEGSLRREAEAMAEEWAPRRDAARSELAHLRRQGEERQGELAATARARLRKYTQDLRSHAGGVRAALEAYQEVVGRSRAELESRDAELRAKWDEELRAVAAEHARRLDDLKAAQARELEHLQANADQAQAHVKRMHESELSTLRMQALQKRRERVHRLEQDFVEERRNLEQMTLQMGFELEQQRQEIEDMSASFDTMRQQVEGMRSAVDEMTNRVDVSEAEVAEARGEAEFREEEVAQLQSDVAVLQVRQRAMGVGDSPVPPPPLTLSTSAAAAGAQAAVKAARAEAGIRQSAAELSGQLRDAISETKLAEAEVGEADSRLAALEEDLTEKEKQIEILEVDIEEARLRSQQLQARILEREAA